MHRMKLCYITRSVSASCQPCVHLVYNGVITSCIMTHGLQHAWTITPQNKGMSDTPTAPWIFFCLPKSHVDLSSPKWLQDTHRPRNHHQKGPICLWQAKEVMESGVRAKEVSKQHWSLSNPPPIYRDTMHQSGLPHPDEYLRLHPLQCNRCTKTKKYVPNERRDQSSRKKKLSDGEIDNISDEEFKTLVIRMLTELIENGHKMKGEMKAVKVKSRKIYRNQQWREGNWDSNQQSGGKKEVINIQLELNEEIRIQKNEEKLKNF